MKRRFAYRPLVAICLALFVAAEACGQTVEYIHTDVLGSPIAVTNSAGVVIERTVHEPYGAVVNRPLSDGPGFTGHVTDSVTGLVYMQQRYYDPTLGRFLSVDPVSTSENGTNFNRYWYANDNPYRFTDPDGRSISCDATSCTIVCHSGFECVGDYIHAGIVYIDRLMGGIGSPHQSTEKPANADKPASEATDEDAPVTPDVTDTENSQPPFTGAPGSTVRGGTGSRRYGEDGYPETDRDAPHPDEAGIGSEDHVHDWGRPPGGGPPTSENRGPARPPQPGDPPPPRGANVPPPPPPPPPMRP
jgi:RHS repeat-associated protein